VRFDARDADLLLAFRERAAPEFPRIAQEFYDRIREHADAHDVFTGEDQIQRLQRSLVAWLSRICGGVYDEQYAEQTAKIGRVHVKIGLPQRYMLTAMALIRIALVRIADRDLGQEAGPTREALLRVLDLELAVMLQTYKDSFAERIREVGRLERTELGDALSRTEHRYVNAVELASVLIVGLDRSGTVRLVNREAERVTGYDRDQLLGQLGEQRHRRIASADLSPGPTIRGLAARRRGPRPRPVSPTARPYRPRGPASARWPGPPNHDAKDQGDDSVE